MGTEETLKDIFGDTPYRMLVEEIRDFAILHLDREGRILIWNAGAAAIFGYEEAEAIGKPFASIFTSEDVESGVPERELKTATETGRAEDARWQQRKDGTRFYATGVTTALRDENGALRGFAKVARDDTARKRVEDELRASEVRYRRIFEAAKDGILILNVKTGQIADANPFMCKLLDYPHAEFVGKELWQIGLFKDKGESQAAFRELREKGYIRYEDLPLETKLGVRREVEFVSNIYREDGHHVIQCNIRDITERKQAEEAQRESEERFHLLVDGAKDHAIFMLDTGGRVTSWNVGVKRVLGYGETEFIGQHFSCIFTPEDIESDDPEKELKKAEVEGQAEDERRHIRKDGTRFWATGTMTPVRDGLGRLRGFAVVMRDNTERRMAEEHTAHAAAHDSLTGLPNQALLNDHLERAIARSKRHDDYMFAVLFLDLDRFKVINDSLGHVLADQLLVEIGRKLEAALRPEDMIARFGGDEFVIFLDDIKDVSDATRVANRIHEELVSPFNIGGNEVFTSTSIGISLSSHGYDRPEDCLRDADTAMYRAKALGKARHEIFDKSMHDRVVTLLRLETDLRRAVGRGEFRVHYQPIISLGTGRISGFEALVRWQHPGRGLIPPAEFISVAEETGLIIPIGQWVLGEACLQTGIWQNQIDADPPLTISVNLSSKQFLQPDLIERIDRMLLETGFDARSLKLEITESVVMENAAEATAMIRQLGDLGVKLYIDDFGTGYSSLSYLDRFPVSMLKIDRSFIERMSAREGDSEIVRTIVALAHNLHMGVIAEGVETEEQLSHLKALQCEYGQGYYFSRPVDAESAGELITRRRLST
jgi:diguanylate cyclase (GGDEF)-like protein/PAS domain S-box-containing protein